MSHLARHSGLKGTEAGDSLLADALQNILNVAESISNRIYLPLKTIQEAMQ